MSFGVVGGNCYSHLKAPQTSNQPPCPLETKMTSAKHILVALEANPMLGNLKINQVHRFLELGTRLLPEILGGVNAAVHYSSPPALAQRFQEFLSFSVDLTLEQVSACWEALYPMLASAESPNDYGANFDDSIFLEHSVGMFNSKSNFKVSSLMMYVVLQLHTLLWFRQIHASR